MATMTPNVARRPFIIKPLHLIGLAIIALSIAMAYYGLSSSFRPYTTSIDEAVTTGRNVQLAGFLGSTGNYDEQGNFTFLLQDETGRMVTVVYAQPKPSNFEQAVSIVAIGHYDQASGAFMAEDLLVKCPSKYQEAQQASS
ncbi:MAG TPA: cytochrome c maturation protein CcmE [Roseiflexaceae bacterium]|nr:cytochrome c maturation protein CcmE [Roseiflexaceae bacterium]HMP40914.1 cytochrome c maturation protein CcmE [Roseiflexaceae bacterium]